MQNSGIYRDYFWALARHIEERHGVKTTIVECAVCHAHGVHTYGPVEQMTAIPYDAFRDGLGRDCVDLLACGVAFDETIYACIPCAEEELEQFEEAYWQELEGYERMFPAHR